MFAHGCNDVYTQVYSVMLAIESLSLHSPRYARAFLAALLRSTVHLFIPFMFIRIAPRTSDCVEVMYVNPITAVVEVAYAKGNVYRYTHVSRRAIANLLLNPNMSLGFWVNNNLLPFNCKTRLFGECTVVSHFEQLMNQQPVAV